MDDGTRIAVRITVDRRPRARSTSRGTGRTSRDNLNAPRAVHGGRPLRVALPSSAPTSRSTPAACGPSRIVIPARVLLADPPTGRGRAGNVETSQRVVDVLLGALGVAAASQGTMNNLTFGDDRRFGYYETICGGAGAGPAFDGA